MFPGPVLFVKGRKKMERNRKEIRKKEATSVAIVGLLVC